MPGVIGAVTGHLASLALPEPSELSWQDFWVDTGLTRDELSAAGVTPGTRVIWDATTERFGPNVVGKALDDRVLLAVQTELLRRLAPADMHCRLTLAATVQEEIGLVGASALAAGRDFDAAIVLEIGLAGDVPGVKDDMMPVRLGGGPLLVHKDALVHYDHGVTRAMERASGGCGYRHPARGLRLVRQRRGGVDARGHTGGVGRLPRALHAFAFRDGAPGRH